ncbi:MAG: mechanosensitive ion channel domain-containing protein [Methanoregula sp.]
MDAHLFYAAIIILAGLCVAGAAHVIVRWLQKIAQTTPTQLDDIVLAAVGKPLVVTILAISVYAAVLESGIVPTSFGGIESTQVVSAFFIIIEAWVVSVFAYNIIHTYGTRVAEKTQTDVDDHMVPLLETAVKYIIWFIALMFLLNEFKIDITPFLAGAGIAGIAAALAAQDLLSNFLGGAIITIDKPFKIGDRIKFDTFLGDVIEIGPRSTRIKTLDNMIVTIPNARITSNVVVNYAQPDIQLKVRIPFSVAYGSDMNKVCECLITIAQEAARQRRGCSPIPHHRSTSLNLVNRALTAS